MGTLRDARRADLISINTFKPLLRAYALGYLTATGPRIFGFLRTVRRNNAPLYDKIQILLRILRTSTQINRFPTACAVLVGGNTALPQLVQVFLTRLLQLSNVGRHVDFSILAIRRLRLVCTFISAWVAFDLLNNDKEWVRKRAQSRGAADVEDFNRTDYPNQHHIPPPSSRPRYAGKTMDFTLFALTRALDIVVISLWHRAKTTYSERRKLTSLRITQSLETAADPAIFAVSAAVIMWSWFYAPDRLPRAYTRWISKAAELDPRIIQALRLARQGIFVYGQDTGQAHLFGGICHDLQLPEKLGDPAQTIPVPCEVYHSGVGGRKYGKSCEIHALARFYRSWKFAMLQLYLPLQALTNLRPLFLSRSQSSVTSIVLRAVTSAARSSSFLAAFVSFFYYAVCLARTRLGPRMFNRKTVTPQMWDSGLCILAGCLACGWSILLEKPASRRQEIAFFVAPRALATLLPRVYDGKRRRYRLTEQSAFAASVTVVLMAASNVNGKRRVRGVLGKLLERMLCQ